MGWCRCPTTIEPHDHNPRRACAVRHLINDQDVVNYVGIDIAADWLVATAAHLRFNTAKNLGDLFSERVSSYTVRPGLLVSSVLRCVSIQVTLGMKSAALHIGRLNKIRTYWYDVDIVVGD